MDAITTYLDHMFQGLPRTAEVQRARTELGQMAEDRFQELMAEGVSEHEAVGRVISQFGNLDELADDLGIRAEFDGARDSRLQFDAEEAERFVEVRRVAGRRVGGGMLLIMVGLAALVLTSARDGAFLGGLFGRNPELHGAGQLPEAIGLGFFFVALAVAVGLFIFAGVSLSRFDVSKRGLDVPLSVRQHYTELREEETPRFSIRIGLANGLILLSVAIVAIGAALSGGNETVRSITAALMMVLIGVAVHIIITAAMRRSTLGLLSGANNTGADERQDSLARFGGIYWLVVTVIYLAWSLIGANWGISWILWPIAGVLFTFLPSIIRAAKKES